MRAVPKAVNAKSSPCSMLQPNANVNQQVAPT